MKSRNDPPTVKTDNDGEITILTIEGNVHDRLTQDAKKELLAALNPTAAPTKLVLDLVNLLRLDSWGEDKLLDLVDRVLENGGHAAAAEDRSRLGLGPYVSINATFARKKVAIYESRQAAIDGVKAQ